MTDLATYQFHRARTGEGQTAHPGSRLAKGKVSPLTTLATQAFRLVRERSRPGELCALDYGCGTGTLTDGLAQALSGGAPGARALGVDPSMPRIREATPTARTRFAHAAGDAVPAPSNQFDLVFVSLVLGGMAGARLQRAATELMRVLKPDGLLIVIAATGADSGGRHWTQRPVADYQRLFPRVGLQPAGEFHEGADHLTLLAGREGEVRPPAD